MEIRIKETNEVKELVYKKDGIECTHDFLDQGNALNYNRETEEFTLDTIDDYDWWAQYFAWKTSDEEEIKAIVEEFDLSFSQVQDELIERMMDAEWDMDMEHDVKQAFIIELKQKLLSRTTA